MLTIINWATIKKIWGSKLWPNRKSMIEPTSAMIYLGGIDIVNMKSSPTFFGYKLNNDIVGVNSGHMCNDNTYRSRGLWVDETHRGQGIGRLLLKATVEKAQEEHASLVWSYPRFDSWHTYKAEGFSLVTPWEISETSEKNAYCSRIYFRHGIMIYLVDNFDSYQSHGQYISDIIGRHSTVEIFPIKLNKNPMFNEVISAVMNLQSVVFPEDIVLCPWAVDANQTLDRIFNELSDLCWVVVAAGNYNQDIKYWSPARAENVITVACLNKSGIKAALSNWSNEKELIWVAGTNYNVGWMNSSGTSVSAAVYAAFLAESLREKNTTMLTELLEQYERLLV